MAKLYKQLNSNQMNDLYNDLLEQLQLETVSMRSIVVYSDTCKDTKPTRQIMPYASFNKGKKVNFALAFASSLVDRYGSKIDRDNYRQAVKSANVAKQAAKRAILAHFEDIRWQDSRFTPLDAMTICKDSNYLKWVKAIDKRHAVILDTLETTYFVRINP